MSELAAALVAHFGPGGLSAYDPERLARSGLPRSSNDLLCASGLPTQVGVYFTAASGAETTELKIDGAEEESLLQLGGDHGAQMVARSDGQVWAVLPAAWGPTRPVSSTVEQFAGSLLILDRYLPLLAAAAQTEQAGALSRRLRDALADIDPAALSTPAHWWMLVLEDIRHTISFPFSAAAKYQVHGSEPQIVTANAALGLPHPEMQLAARLAQLGAEPASVSELYTELQACQMPGHYCAFRAGEFFPRAVYTYAHDYGRDPRQRQESLIAAAQQAADATAAAGR